MVLLTYRYNITERNVYHISATHKGCAELIKLIAAAVADDTSLCAVACPDIITESFIQFCQDSKLCRVGHYGLYVAVSCHVCLCSLCTDSRALSVNLYNCKIVEGNIAANSGMAACGIIVNQAACHPETGR